MSRDSSTPTGSGYGSSTVPDTAGRSPVSVASSASDQVVPSYAVLAVGYADYTPEELRDAYAMLQDNDQRKIRIFPTYDPISGSGSPGPRSAIYIKDLLEEDVTWLVPDEIFDADYLWARLAVVHSVHYLVMDIYGDYNPDLRALVVCDLLRTRAKYDFYFYAYHVKIVNKSFGEDINFLLRPAQIKLVETFEEQRRAGLPIRVIICKARQWGGSTATDIYASWMQLMWETSKDSLIVGHQSDSSIEVRDMLFKAIQSIPAYFLYTLGEDFDESKPRIRGGGNQNIYEVPCRNCKIKTGTALNNEGPRSGHQSIVHYTEVAFWPETEKLDPKKMIKAGSSAVPMLPHTMVVYESTANGQNFFKDEWDRAFQVDEYGEKVSLFVPLFVAWFEIELYMMQPPVKGLPPVPDEIRPMLSVSTHTPTAAVIPDAEADVTAEQARWALLMWAVMLLRRRNDKQNHWDYLYWLWEVEGATLEGIYWYWQKMREYGSLEDMQQEFPSNSVEAFKYAGACEFDLHTVEKRRKAFSKAPSFVGDIAGSAPKGRMAVDRLQLYELEVGPLHIWDMPDRDWKLKNRYLVSVDIGGKYKTSDFSCITVFDRADMMLSEDGTLNEDAGPTVVAEWYGHTDPDLLAIKCAQIATFYDNALLVVENNTAYSRMNNTDSDDVTELFFPILIPIYDNIYAHNQSNAKLHQDREVKLGFNTNRSTKVSIIKYMSQCLRDCLYIERDSQCFKEMTWFMKFPNNKYGAIPGKHDDKVMSRAIGLYVSRFAWDLYPVKVPPSEEQRQKTIQRINARSSAMASVISSSR